MKIIYYSIFFSLLLFTGCKSTSTSTSQTSRYSEDLSHLRPRLETPVDTSFSITTPPRKTEYVEAKHTINKPLETILDSINRFHVSRKFIDGFSIQVYSGNDRLEALNIRKGLTNALPDLESEVQYTPPNFRVKAGKYFTRIEAQKDFVAVKKHFPSAIVIPDKIEIN